MIAIKHLYPGSVVAAMAPKRRTQGSSGGAESSQPSQPEKQRRLELGTDAFDCPICNVPMVDKIFQCSKGHSVCGECLGKLESTRSACPTCQVRFPTEPLRNFALESVASHCKFPCKFGCDFWGKPEDLRQHAKICELRPFSCPFNGCNHESPARDWLKHVMSDIHKYTIRDSSRLLIKVGNTWSHSWASVLIYQDANGFVCGAKDIKISEEGILTMQVFHCERPAKFVLTFGNPTDHDQLSIRGLTTQLGTGNVVVKLPFVALEKMITTPALQKVITKPEFSEKEAFWLYLQGDCI